MSENSTRLDLDTIEACAIAASEEAPGPWYRDVYEDGEEGEGPHGVYPGSRGPMVESNDVVAAGNDESIYSTEVATCHRPAIAAHVVGLDPPTVIALVAEARRMRSERDTLGKAIADAAQEAGGYNGEVPLTGPHLLLLLRDMAAEVRRLRTIAAAERALRKAEEIVATDVVNGDPVGSGMQVIRERANDLRMLGVEP